MDNDDSSQMNEVVWLQEQSVESLGTNDVNQISSSITLTTNKIIKKRNCFYFQGASDKLTGRLTSVLVVTVAL